MTALPTGISSERMSHSLNQIDDLALAQRCWIQLIPCCHAVICSGECGLSWLNKDERCTKASSVSFLDVGQLTHIGQGETVKKNGLFRASLTREPRKTLNGHKITAWARIQSIARLYHCMTIPFLKPSFIGVQGAMTGAVNGRVEPQMNTCCEPRETLWKLSGVYRSLSP